jgi:hypothetical protein
MRTAGACDGRLARASLRAIPSIDVRPNRCAPLPDLMRRALHSTRCARSNRRLPRSGLLYSALDVSPIALDIWQIDARASSV